MKIAIFTDTFYPEINGVTTFLNNFIKHFSQNHVIRIYAPKYKTRNELKFNKNVTIYRCSSFSLLTNKSTRVSMPNVIKMLVDCKKFNPDIIHIHTPAIIGTLGLYYGKLFKKPIVATYHTYFPDFLVYLSPIKIVKELLKLLNKKIRIKKKDKDYELTIKRIKRMNKKIRNSEVLKRFKKINKIKRIPKSLVWLLTGIFYNNCDLVTTPSMTFVNILSEHKIKKPIVYLSNGIELDLFKYKERNKKDDNFTFLYVGRLGFEKNVDVVIKAINILIKKGYDIKLIIVGDGPAKEELEKLVKLLRIERFVTFTGAINRDNLITYYHNADVFVTASTIETQGIVVLEAMATGMPIIGVRKLALKELIIDNYNGFLAEPFNAKDMADKCEILIKHKELIKEFSKNSYLIAKKHDINSTMKKLERIYNSLINSRKRKIKRKEKILYFKKKVKMINV